MFAAIGSLDHTVRRVSRSCTQGRAGAMIATQMEIAVKVSPIKSYPTAVNAIAGAARHPSQPQAKADSLRFVGRKFVRGTCSLTRCSLEFSDSLWLEFSCENDALIWQVSEAPPVFDAFDWPCTFIWPRIGPAASDPTGLFANRVGADFWQLRINDAGILLYLRGREILSFHLVHSEADDSPILYVGDLN